MKICAKCKKENDEHSRFCESCGLSLDEPAAGPSSPRSCPSCERSVSALARFCTHCGQKLPGAGQADLGPSCPACGSAMQEADSFCGWCGLRQALSQAGPQDGQPQRADGAGRLTVLAGREKDKTYSVGSAGIRIGRSRDNDVSLDTDAYVSASHARILRQGDDYYIEDAGSINGTFVRLRRSTRLEPGDEIKVGQSLFRFEP